MRPRHILSLLASTILLLSLAASLASCGGKTKGELVNPGGGVFTIDTAGIKKGDVRFFRREAGGKTVVFMVARDDFGEIKTAFDACITCYPHKQGYRHADGSVACIYCGNTFPDRQPGQGHRQLHAHSNRAPHGRREGRNSPGRHRLRRAVVLNACFPASRPARLFLTPRN